MSEWVSKFNALGIEYDVNNMENITVTNINLKLDSLQKIIQNWTHRNISPIGRVCVSKSLLVSKITHVLQSLPSPPKDYFKKLEKLLVDFIWKNKRHEINKTLLCSDYNMGGLKMMDLIEFDMSLKLTWVRKTLTGNFEWTGFAKEYKIDRLVWTGGMYHNELSLRTKDSFWKSVIVSFKKWNTILTESLEIDTDKQPLWGNPYMNIPFNDSLYRNNITLIRDIVSHNGTIMTKNELEMKLGESVMLTTIFSLTKSIPKTWKIAIQNTPISYNVYRPPSIDWLTKDSRGTQNIRKIWQLNKTHKPPPGQSKWELELEMGNEEDWKCLYLIPIKCKMNARSSYLQFQILHRTLVKNRKLLQFGIKDTEKCDRCDEVETISHLLYECPYAQKIWSDTKIWLSKEYAQTFHIDKKSVLIGNIQNETIINYVFIIIKHEIYKSKWNKNTLTIYKIKRILKDHMGLDIYLGTINNKLSKVLGKWSTLYNHLNKQP